MKMYYSNMASVPLPKGFSIGILISYYGLKKLDVPEFCNSLFLDSGAFSAWTKKVAIDVHEYIDFIKANENKIDVYAALDDITDGNKSLENYKIMVKKGLDPMPCFHIGEDEAILQKYVRLADYIALGGIAKRNKQVRVKWLDRIFSDYPSTKFHGFGIQDRTILLRYPWYSVDSSSAHVMARFGGICTPWGDLKINPEVQSKDLQWKRGGGLFENRIREYVNSLGYPYEQAITNDPEGTLLRCAINVTYYEKLCSEKTVKGPAKIGGFGAAK